MSDLKTARTLVTSLLTAGLCLSPVVLHVPASAAHASPLKAQTCDISGWLETESANGRKVSVRAVPSANGRISGRLPTDDRHYGGAKARQLAEFDIVETRGGWFRIANVRIITIRSAFYDARPSNITGWIKPSAVRFNVQSSRGFAKPNSESAILVTSPSWIMTSWLTLYDCEGIWAQVETIPEDANEPYPATELPQVKAWFRGICGLSMIECDDVPGD